MIDARLGEGDDDGIQLFSDGIGIQQEVLAAGVKLLVARKNVVDFILCDSFMGIAEFGADLNVLQRRSFEGRFIDLVLLVIGFPVKEFGRIEVIRVKDRVITEDLQIVRRPERYVLHIEIEFAAGDRGKCQLSLCAALGDDEGVVLSPHDILAEAVDFVRYICALKLAGELLYGTRSLHDIVGLCHGIGEQDLLLLRRGERIELVPVNRLFVRVPHGQRVLVGIYGICRGLVERGIAVAGRQLFGMQAVQVTDGSEFIEDRPSVKIGELPCIVVYVGDTESVQILQDVGIVDAPERLGGRQSVQDRGVLVPESGLRVGNSHKSCGIVADRAGDLRGVIEPHIPVIGRRRAHSRLKCSQAVHIFIGPYTVLEIGVVFGDPVYADTCDHKVQDHLLCPLKACCAACLSLGILDFCVGLFQRRLILCFLSSEHIEERDESKRSRTQESEVGVIVQEDAEDKIDCKARGHHSFLAFCEREEIRPQLGDDHGDQRGVRPAPSVDRIGHPVCQIAEGGKEQQNGIQKKLQAQFEISLGAEEKENAQERDPRIAERTVFHLVAGQEIHRQHAAGRNTVKGIDRRLKVNPLVAEHSQGHRKKDNAANCDTDGPCSEQNTDLLETAADLTFLKGNIAEQRVDHGHEHDTDNKIEIAHCRKADGNDKGPGLISLAHFFDPVQNEREYDQRVQKDRLPDAGDQRETAESIDQGAGNAAVLMLLGGPAEAAQSSKNEP